MNKLLKFSLITISSSATILTSCIAYNNHKQQKNLFCLDNTKQIYESIKKYDTNCIFDWKNKKEES